MFFLHVIFKREKRFSANIHVPDIQKSRGVDQGNPQVTDKPVYDLAAAYGAFCHQTDRIGG
jgi:hypothetical protein